MGIIPSIFIYTPPVIKPVLPKTGFFYCAFFYSITVSLPFHKYLLKSELIQLLEILQIVISYEEAPNLWLPFIDGGGREAKRNSCFSSIIIS